MKKKTISPPNTVITLTLPETGGAQRTGTLLVSRGDLAKLTQIRFADSDDLAEAIRTALNAIAELEFDPPPTNVSAAQPATPSPEPSPAVEEPTVDVPTKTGSVAVKMSHLKIVAGETDAAAYRQAVLIASRLIDAGLWDGSTALELRDVYGLRGRLKALTDEALAGMTLQDVISEQSETEGTPSAQTTLL